MEQAATETEQALVKARKLKAPMVKVLPAKVVSLAKQPRVNPAEHKVPPLGVPDLVEEHKVADKLAAPRNNLVRPAPVNKAAAKPAAA